MDDIPKDPLTGGDGHLDGIKSYLYDDDKMSYLKKNISH